jgi:hypothetical protein
MAQLAANRPVPNTLQQRMDLAGGVELNMVMTASTTIYEGAFVGIVPGTGTVAPLVDTHSFAGIALEKKVSDGTAGSTKIKVFCGGYFQHAITSLVVADVGKVCFCVSGTSDSSIDITSTTLPAIGRIVNFVSAGVGVIKMKNCGQREGMSDAATLTYTAVEL